jgi:hypothetical protein
MDHNRKKTTRRTAVDNQRSASTPIDQSSKAKLAHLQEGTREQSGQLPFNHLRGPQRATIIPHEHLFGFRVLLILGPSSPRFGPSRRRPR